MRYEISQVMALDRLRNRVPWPGLRPADVHDALAYAHDHFDEIENDLAADDEAVARTRLGKGETGG